MNCESKEIERLMMGVDEPDNALVELAQMIGIAQFKTVLDILGGPLGMQFYIPTYGHFIAAFRRTLRDQNIISTYDGTAASIKVLAVKHGITKTRVRQILANERKG